MEKLDFKKEYKDLYLPKTKPMLIDVPAMTFMMVDGRGDPLHEEYRQAMEILYGLTFTIKMSKMTGERPEGYIEYVVPPLEGLWWNSKQTFNLHQRDGWLWTSMIRQPAFVTTPVFEWAVMQCRKKKPDVDYTKARLETFTEGECVQMMHIGPYSEEPATVEKLHAFIIEKGLKNMTGDVRKHHEIYLGDPRKTAPEKLKTVIRLPVE